MVEPTFGPPERDGQPLSGARFGLEATPDRGLAFRCGLCGAALDVTTARIAEAALAVCGHLEGAHGLDCDEAHQELFRVSGRRW